MSHPTYQNLIGGFLVAPLLIKSRSLPEEFAGMVAEVLLTGGFFPRGLFLGFAVFGLLLSVEARRARGHQLQAQHRLRAGIGFGDCQHTVKAIGGEGNHDVLAGGDRRLCGI